MIQIKDKPFCDKLEEKSIHAILAGGFGLEV